MATETQILNIDTQLRFVLFGLECALNVEFNPSAVERLFSEAADGATEVRYTFWSGPGAEVTGYVEDYEPGTVWLTVQTRRGYKPPLSVIAERAQYRALRWARGREKEHDPGVEPPAPVTEGRDDT